VSRWDSLFRSRGTQTAESPRDRPEGLETEMISTPDPESLSEMMCFKRLPEVLDLPLDQRERASVLEVNLEERTHVDEIAKGVSSSEEAGPAVDTGLTLGARAVTTPEWNES